MALEKQLDQETKDVLIESHSASKSLIYVIDDLLHLTGNAYQSPLPMVHITFDLRDTVQSTLDQLQKHATQKMLSFRFEQNDDVPRHVCSDLHRFQQALTQLVTNAIKHTTQGGINIRLAVQATTEEYCVVQVSVQDTGIGMSERGLDELFQEFEQVPDEDIDSDDVSMHNTGEGPSRIKKEAKLGLGLALVARYIKQCGGQVRGKSIAGEGSTFSLDIPMQLGKEDALGSPASSTTPRGPSGEKSGKGVTGPALCPTDIETASASTHPNFRLHIDRARRSSERSPMREASVLESILTIRSASQSAVNRSRPVTPVQEKPAVLIADDNTVNLSILKRRLEKMGHEVKTSLDGQQCFEVFQEHQDAMHFILMDINVCTVTFFGPLQSAYYFTQMPIVDGIQSTKMIRILESVEPPNSTTHSTEFAAPLSSSSTIAIDLLQTSRLPHHTAVVPPISPPPTNLGPEEGFEGTPNPGYFNLPLSPSSSDLASTQGSVAPPLVSPMELPATVLEQPKKRAYVPRRIPIFAVSAGLDRHSQESLENAGFDGWLSKPIDFKKLGVIMEGVLRPDARVLAKSRAGDYVGGGWFG